MIGELRIPFRHHDRDGVVAVDVSRIDTGPGAGFDILPGLPFGPAAAVGYPEMSANITYAGTGYRQFMGWIQIVRTTRTWPMDEMVDATQVDMNATWNDRGNPFFAYGYPAAIYDAPSNNLNGAQRLEWRADTFLTTVPLRSRTEPIRPLAAFAWGYSETSDPAAVPSILAPVEIEIDAWARHSDLLGQDFPDWTWG